MKQLLSYIVIIALLPNPVFAEGQPVFVEKKITKEALKELQKGGFVIYMRHGNSDTAHPDQVPRVDLNDCTTQRPLTETGRQVAAGIGNSIRKLHIPVGEIISSPMCRAKESAQAAFGENFTLDNNLMYTSNMTYLEKLPILQETRILLSKPVPDGSNRVLVSHAPNLMDLVGYFPNPEGAVIIFKPVRKKGFEYIGTIPPQQWQLFLK